ncbi:hypothetical protein LEMLEM_LOCUS17565 [Lemmus lemmus]
MARAHLQALDQRAAARAKAPPPALRAVQPGRLGRLPDVSSPGFRHAQYIPLPPARILRLLVDGAHSGHDVSALAQEGGGHGGGDLQPAGSSRSPPGERTVVQSGHHSLESPPPPVSCPPRPCPPPPPPPPPRVPCPPLSARQLGDIRALAGSPGHCVQPRRRLQGRITKTTDDCQLALTLILFQSCLIGLASQEPFPSAFR